jgi:PPOX class probable F420-dependent enzyme
MWLCVSMTSTPVALPDDLKAVLDSRAFAHLTTLDPDGAPQSSAMWIMRDGDRILFNTAEGRRKWRNLKRDSRISISISKQDDPYNNWSIQGKVIEMRTSDGVDVIDALARKYIDGADKYPWLKPGMVRVTIVVEPTRIAGNR